MRRKLLLAGGLGAAVLVAVGVVLLISGIERLSETRLGETRTPVPGEREVSLEAQKYVIYYEVDDEFAPSGDGALADPLLDISIRDGDGSSLDTDDYRVNFNVTSGGRYAQAISTVEPSVSGDYRLRVEGDESARETAVVLGRPVGERLAGLLVGAIVLVVGLCIALFVGIVALVGRRRPDRAASPGY